MSVLAFTRTVGDIFVFAWSTESS